MVNLQMLSRFKCEEKEHEVNTRFFSFLGFKCLKSLKTGYDFDDLCLS